nr:hypothetical protein BHI3_23890 [Bacteriovorax sp. HI3]
MAYNILPSIYGLSKDLTVFTDGFNLEPEMREKILRKNVLIVETKIESLIYDGSVLKNVMMENGKSIVIDRLFIAPKLPFLMKSDLGIKLGSEVNEFGIFKVTDRNETTIPGVFAAGDAMSMVQTTLFAVASGNMAGAAAISSLLNEEF